jgi:hypothetical protein
MNVILACTVWFFAYQLETEKQKNQTVKAEDYIKWLTTLPTSHFKSNMLIVFRAEFEKDSKLLFTILESYNEIKNEENEELQK